MTDPVIPAEMAEQEFDRFVNEMDLELDPAYMDEEDAAQFRKLKSRLIKAIMKGSLAVNENGEAVYTPQNEKSKHKEPITFHERTGSSLMAMDGKKRNYDIAKTYAVMGEMCKVHPSVFAGLVGIDVKICENIFQLLMD